MVAHGRRAERDRERQRHHYRRMTEREVKADGNGAFALLHQLASDVVDGGNVIGVHRVAQAERVGEERGAQEQRVRRREEEEGQNPNDRVGD